MNQKEKEKLNKIETAVSSLVDAMAKNQSNNNTHTMSPETKASLDGLHEKIEDGFSHTSLQLIGICDANEKAHAGLMDKQDKTNGNVRRLQLWRAYLTGGFVVLSGIVAFLGNEIISYVKRVETTSAVTMEDVKQQIVNELETGNYEIIE